MSTVRVLVTRPAADAQHWAQVLRQGGIEAEVFPLIEIASLQPAASMRAIEQAWLALQSYSACMFVSGHAVEHFFKQNPLAVHGIRLQDAIDKIASPRFMAPGPGTVAALLAAGVAPARIDAPAPDAPQFDSEALWQVIGQRDWQGRRILVVRGQSADATPGSSGSSGRDWLARQWAAAGAQVDFLSVYERRPPTLSAAQRQRAVAASADGSVWLFSSSEAVANLAGMPGMQGLDWSGACALVTHPRIAATVRALGWGVVVESRPALEDVRQTLGSIESGLNER